MINFLNYFSSFFCFCGSWNWDAILVRPVLWVEIYVYNVYNIILYYIHYINLLYKLYYYINILFLYIYIYIYIIFWPGADVTMPQAPSSPPQGRASGRSRWPGLPGETPDGKVVLFPLDSAQWLSSDTGEGPPERPGWVPSLPSTLHRACFLLCSFPSIFIIHCCCPAEGKELFSVISSLFIETWSKFQHRI